MKILQTYKIAASVALACISTVSFAQAPNITDQAQTQQSTNDAVNTSWKPSLVKDGVFDQTPHVSNPLTWQPTREADVMWKKRVWREIDVREKQNQAFRYPGDENTGGGYFIEILLDAVKKGKVKAYSTFDDRFTTAMSKQEVMDQLTGKDDSTLVTDPVTGAQTVQITHKDFDPETVIKYRLKEDWIFDRNLGRMVVRIMGIAPIVAKMDPTTGEARGQSALFWIYYPDARQALAQYEVFNPDNDVQRLTWDDYFENRFFSSYVIKASNVYDETLQNMHPGVESLYEAQRINEQIFNKEHDMWVY
jgi:gliding motility associated protien GldN